MESSFLQDRMLLLTEQALLQAKRGDQQARDNLLMRYRPFCIQCAWRAKTLLRHEEDAVLFAEAQYQFLLLIDEFEAERGVPFNQFIRRMLPQRMSNWAQKE